MEIYTYIIYSMARKKHIINVHTSTGTTQPTGASLSLGEIAVQHTSGSPALWIKMGNSNDSEVYEKFIGETEILNIINQGNILGSGYTYSGISYVNSATTIADAYSALTNELIKDEYITAAAINDHEDRILNLEGSTFDPTQYYTTADTYNKTEVNELLNQGNILGSGYTYSGLPYVNSSTTIADAYSALTKEVLDNEATVSAALNDLNDANTVNENNIVSLSGATQELIELLETISAQTSGPMILGSGYTYSGIPYVNSATTIADAYSALTNELIKNEDITAAALNDLNGRVIEMSGAIATKQDVLVAGEGITISGNVISVQESFVNLKQGNVLSFYTTKPVSVVVSAANDDVRTVEFSANTIASVNIKEDDEFVINNPQSGITAVYSWPGVCEEWQDWFDDVQLWSNTIFHFSDGSNTYIDPEHWHGTNQQGRFGVTEAQYKNCIFWDDNPMTNNVNTGPYFILHKTIECPLFYSTISANTYSWVKEPYNVLLNPNWNNPVFISSFESGPGSARGYMVFSYCNQRSIPSATFTDPDVGTNIITLPAAINGLCSYGGMETVGTFDATNVTNWQTGSTNWNAPFIGCYKLKELRIQNLKANLNVSWSPLSYESLSYLVENAANTSPITIQVSSRSYYDIDDALRSAAATKNITFVCVSGNNKNDVIWEDVTDIKDAVDSISAKTNGTLTLNLNGTQQGIYSPSASTTIDVNVTGADVLLTGYEIACGTTEEELVITSADTTNSAFGKVQKQIYDNEMITAAALNDLNDAIGGSFDDVEYVSSTKTIVFKHGNTVVDSIDATDFIKDGMVNTVVVDTPSAGTNSGVTCLIITFNTDAGKEDIEIPLSELFDTDSVYTKEEIDAKNFDKLGSGYTYSGISYVNSATTIADAYSALTYEVIENELTTATALNDLDARIIELSASTSDPSALTGITEDLEALSAVVYVHDVVYAAALNDVNDNIQELSGTTTSLLSHTTNNAIHVTAAEKTAWTDGANRGASAYTQVQSVSAVVGSISAVVDTVSVAVNTVSAAVESLSASWIDDEYVIATAINELRDKIDEISGNTAGGGGSAGGDGITGITMNGNNVSVNNGVASLGTVVTAQTQLSTGTTTGTGNVVTDISVSNHQISLAKNMTIPAWATAATKPSYTASEVGALPTGTTLDNVADGSTRKLSDYASSANVTNLSAATTAMSANVDKIAVTGVTVNGTGNAITGATYANSALTLSKGNVVTGETQLSTASTGTGNVVTDITVSNHQITKNLGMTVPSWATASTKPSYTANEVGALPTGTTLDNVADGTTRKLSDYATTGAMGTHSATTIANGTSSQMHLPTVTSSDNNKILQVVNGSWALVTPVTIYNGTGTPDNQQGQNGDIYLQTS